VIHGAKGARLAAVPASDGFQFGGRVMPNHANISRITGASAARNEMTAIFPADEKHQTTGRPR